VAHLREDKNVEEVHTAQEEEDDADLFALQLDRLPKGEQRSLGGQSERDISDIDEVEAYDEQVIHGVGQVCISVKGVDEKDPSILMERPGDPNRKSDADREIDEVACRNVHCRTSLSFFEHIQNNLHV
jgi:hypothetical protein